MKPWRKNIYFFLAILSLLGLWACKNGGDEDSQEPIAALNQAALSLSGCDPTLPDDELTPLADIGEALIVGLGEATHGTHEFFAMKHRLFRYLVERCDFRAFAIESDYGESIYFDRWLNGGPGDLDNMMRNTMHFWVWRTVEVKAFLEWMRRTNLDRPQAERLHYIGVDCQFATYQPDLLREYLNEVSLQHLAEIEPLLVREEAIRDTNFRYLSQVEYQAMQAELEAEYTAWEGWREEFTRRSSGREFEVARQLLRSLIQVNETSYLSADTARDRYMADNALWAQRQFGEGRGIALWAHNAHVAKGTQWLGSYLSQALGDRYKVIGFSFCQGSFTARGFDPVSSQYTEPQAFSITTPPLANSVNDLFFSASSKMFILRLQGLPQDNPLHAWFSQARRMLLIGAVYNGRPEDCYGDPEYIAQLYDILIHFNQTTFAAQI